MDLTKSVAIVGAACNFPGGEDMKAFWNTLKSGTCCMEEIRPDRWNIEAFFDEDKDAPGKTYAKHAAFIEGWDEWDNTFYGISEKEAERMDPQQKIALDCVYSAVENAGLPHDSLAGTETAVFMGQMNDDVSRMSEMDFSAASSYHGTGFARSILSNRVSYQLDLHGPSATVDTACSSGLMAIHLGIQSILNGESTMAICGGVSLILSPSPFVVLSKARMISEKGKCHAYSADADGYARGEGCGVVILKRVDQAIKNGDRILAYLATGVNQDGKAVTPMTAPSGEIQKRLLRRMYKSLSIDPKDIQYAEGHGTGTKAGDPVEVASLGEIIGSQHQGKAGACRLGSVKTNIGHTESAAGLAGIIKVLLMIKHEQFVPSLHFDRPNPNIKFNDLGMKVVTQNEHWPALSSNNRLACINCFGFGGTNSHAVIQSNHKPTHSHQIPGPSPMLFAFSAKSHNALIDSINDTVKAIKMGDIEVRQMSSLSYTSTAKRSHFRYRNTFVAETAPELLKVLAKGTQASHAAQSKPSKVVFVFVGIGTHWTSMGLQLFKTQPVFAKKIQEISDLIFLEDGWSIIEELSGAKLSDPRVGQPAIFAIQVALAELWKHWGVQPWAIIGHSVGEVAACHVAGYLSLRDAVKVISSRGKALSKAKGGAMLAVGKLSLSVIRDIIRKYSNIEIAAENSPTSYTLSGDSEAISEVHKHLEKLPENGTPKPFVRLLQVQVAFHSHHLDTVLPELEEMLEIVRIKKDNKKTKEVLMISTVSGQLADCEDFVTPHYWTQNTRRSVLFATGLQTIRQQTGDPLVFVEIGPKPALARNIIDCFEGESDKPVVLPSMKDGSEYPTMIKSLSSLHDHNTDINWKMFWGPDVPEIVDYPRYRYQRKKLMFEVDSISAWRLGKKRVDTSSFSVKHKTLTSISDRKWTCSIDQKSCPFVYDHRRSNKPVIPAAMYVDISLGVLGLSSIRSGYELSISFVKVYQINQEDITQFLTVEVDSQNTMPDDVRFYIKGNDSVLSHGHGHMCKLTAPSQVDISGVQRRCKKTITTSELYELLGKSRFTYGKRMRCFVDGLQNDCELLAKLHISTDIKIESDQMVIHPAVLDTALQLSVVLISSGENTLAAPVALQRLRLYGDPLQTKWIYMKRTLASASQHEFSVWLLSESGQVICTIERLVIKNLNMELSAHPLEVAYETKWCPTDVPKSNNASATNVWHFYRNRTLKRWADEMLGNNTVSYKMNEENIKRFTKEDITLNLSKGTPTSIVFSWGISDRPSSSHFNSTDVEELETTCWSALNLMKQVTRIVSGKKGESIPIVIITRHAVLGHDQHRNRRIVDGVQRHVRDSLIGYSLWGTARSAAREGAPICLIDMNDIGDNEMKSLTALCQSQTKIPEWLLVGEKSYSNEFVPILDPMNSSMLSVRLGLDDVLQALGSIKHGSLEVSFKPNVIRTVKTAYRTEVRVKSFRIHPLSWYPLILEQPNIEYSDLQENPLLVLDFTARGATAKDRDRLVCQPTMLSEVVQVDCRLFVPASLLPCEHPILSSWLVAWDILTNHCKGFNKMIYIIDTSNKSVLASCIRGIAPALDFTVLDKKLNGFVGSASIVIDYEMTSIAQIIKEQRVNSRKAIFVNMKSSFRERTSSSKDPSGFVQYYQVAEHLRLEKLVQMVPKFRKWLGANPFTMNSSRIEKEFPRIVDLSRDHIQDRLIIEYIHCGYDHIYKFPDRTILPRNEDVLINLEKPFKHNASYVLIGGTKGLGLEILKFLATNGAGCIFPVSRSKPDKNVIDLFSSLMKAYNVSIKWTQADVADYTSLKTAFHVMEGFGEHRSIKGVFHGAVVVRDAILRNMDREKFRVPLPAKIEGVLNLHKLTKHMFLDYFVLHSSVTATIGNIGQTGYGAANAFLDAFARYRRSIGLPAQSIIWAGLDLGILEAQESAKRHVLAQGINLLTKKEIISCFQHAILNNPVEIVYAKLDWVKMMPKLLSEPSNLAERLQYLGLGIWHQSAMNLDAMTAPVKRELVKITSKKILQKQVVKILSEQLVVEESDIENMNNIPLVDMGLTSMDVLSLIDIIMQDYGISVEVDSNGSMNTLTDEIWEIHLEHSEHKPISQKKS